jgi:hypothetical protein
MGAATDGEEGRWMTYAELAAIRGIDRQSAARLSWRRHWRRQKDNHGTLRVFVPIEWQDGSQDASRDEPREPSRDVSRDMSRVIEPLEAAITLLGEQLGEANRRADGATTRLDAVLTVADGLHRQIAAMEVKLAAAEAGAAEVPQLRAAVDAEHSHGIDLEARIAGLHDLLADAEHRLTEAEGAKETALRLTEAMEQAEAERRGKGRWARLRSAWRGE